MLLTILSCVLLAVGILTAVANVQSGFENNRFTGTGRSVSMVPFLDLRLTMKKGRDRCTRDRSRPRAPARLTVF